MKERLSHLKRHYHRNFNWLSISVVTFFLGIFLYQQRHVISESPHFISVGFLDTTPMLIVVFTVSVLGIFISLWNITLFGAKYILIGALETIWLLFFFAFVQVDMIFGKVSIGAGLSLYIVLMILAFARGGKM
ncbi:hypothetical protein [Lactobacillus terrae]|uniref:hypothetical protein n=1 Tax=Lactobacillus terrae TaxID=2269374 RepID=UPI000C1B61A3|nr:hypothetical protein [Lactobacillus terrae]